MITMAKPTTPLRELNARMIELLGTLAQGQGFPPSRLPGVRFMRSHYPIPRSPIKYDPCIVIIAQGRKVGRLGTKTFVYDPNHYLALTMPLPFECETYGTAREPLLGISIGITPALIAEILVQLEHPIPEATSAPEAAQATRLDAPLAEATVRLLEALRSDDDTRVLGAQLVREIAYRALCGPLGTNLRALAAPHSHFGQIGRVLHRLHLNYSTPIEVDALARDAGMSVSAFHSHFKAVTASSPLQYLKTIRLHKARLLMVHDGLTAATAALRVGYESASQFSREFKRHFGDGPATMAQAMRKNLVQLI